MSKEKNKLKFKKCRKYKFGKGNSNLVFWTGLLLPKTGRTTKRAVSWANKMAGPAANMEAPNWYTCVGIPAKYNKNTG